MFNDERVGGIDYYKQQLLSQRGPIQGSSGTISLWQKLADYCSKMSADQQNFVEKSQRVLESRTRMMEAFSLYLFERHKDEFIQLDSFRELCDGYVNTVIDTSKEYSAQVARTANENASLKARIAELERKLNGNSNSSGT